MPKLVATESDLLVADAFLKARRLKHLSAKKRADTVSLQAGPADDPWPRVRFRLLTKQRWALDVADPAGRWESTPFQAPLTELLDLVAERFSWLLADL